MVLRMSSCVCRLTKVAATLRSRFGGSDGVSRLSLTLVEMLPKTTIASVPFIFFICPMVSWPLRRTYEPTVRDEEASFAEAGDDG